MLKNFFAFIAILLLLNSCNDKFDHLKFEKEVAYEIFPQLMDSLHLDTRVPIPPPPMIHDSNGKVIGFDTIESKRRWQEFETLKKEYYKDSVKLVTAIRDSTFLLDGKDKSEFLKYFNLGNTAIDTINIHKKYKVEIDRLLADKKINLIYLSDLPEGGKIWSTEDGFSLNSIVTISRIQFDKNKHFGVMTIGLTIGISHGSGFRVFIKKAKDKWIIDKIILSEIS
ncbi:hypothetical protein E0K83_16855 [Gramella sp. BOM4]|nr:hypothetical protein [Christiangramia bathymodioli]